MVSFTACSDPDRQPSVWPKREYGRVVRKGSGGLNRDSIGDRRNRVNCLDGFQTMQAGFVSVRAWKEYRTPDAQFSLGQSRQRLVWLDPDAETSRAGPAPPAQSWPRLLVLQHVPLMMEPRFMARTTSRITKQRRSRRNRANSSDRTDPSRAGVRYARTCPVPAAQRRAAGQVSERGAGSIPRLRYKTCIYHRGAWSKERGHRFLRKGACFSSLRRLRSSRLD